MNNLIIFDPSQNKNIGIIIIDKNIMQLNLYPEYKQTFTPKLEYVISHINKQGSFKTKLEKGLFVKDVSPLFLQALREELLLKLKLLVNSNQST